MYYNRNISLSIDDTNSLTVFNMISHCLPVNPMATKIKLSMFFPVMKTVTSARSTHLIAQIQVMFGCPKCKHLIVQIPNQVQTQLMGTFL